MTKQEKQRLAVKQEIVQNQRANKNARKNTQNVNLNKPPAQKGLFSSLVGSGDAPKTVQDTLPYKYIYADGVCALPNLKYNKTVSFFDINYQLARQEDQQLIFGKWCKFLNAFKDDVEVQFSFTNKFTNKKDLEMSIDIPSKRDGFNALRKEYRDMLRNQLSKGNNGLMKEKFVTFTIAAKNLKEARAKLSRLEAEVMKNFKEIGVRSNPLDGKERIQLLHSQLHPLGREKADFDWGDMTKTGMNSKDIVAPSSFDFKDSKIFQVGESYGSVSYLHVLATELPDDILSQFIGLEAAQTVSIHARKIDYKKATTFIRRKLTSINAEKLAQQKKASEGNYDPDIMSPEIKENAEEAEALLKDVRSRKESFFMISIMLMHVAETKQKLNTAIASASSIAEKEGCSLRPLTYQQEQGLVSSLALGMNQIEVERGITTSGLGIFVPFTTSELFEGGHAVYYGLNALSNNMIMADRKNLVNPNGGVLGVPGTGKSFASKGEMFDNFLTTNDDILVIDPEREYRPVIEMMDGQVVSLSQSSDNAVNPLDIHRDYAADEKGADPIDLKLNFILSLFELIMVSEVGLSPVERTVIAGCVRRMYQAYFAISSPKPTDMPILGDLYQLIVGVAESDPRQDKREAAGYIASALEFYVEDGLNMFNRHTNVKLDNRVVCFDISSLESHLKKLGMLIVQDAIWGRVSKNRDNLVDGKRKFTWLYIDEFHLLLQEKQTATYCEAIWKRFRKWGGVPTVITYIQYLCRTLLAILKTGGQTHENHSFILTPICR